MSCDLIERNSKTKHPKTKLTLVGIQQIHLHIRVTRVQENEMQNLQHGSDTRTTSYHDNLTRLAILFWLSKRLDKKLATLAIFHVTLGTLHLNGVSNLQRVQMLTHFATLWEFWVDVGLINLNDQGYFANRAVVGHGSVRSLDHLAVRALESEGNVLTRWQTQDMSFGQSKGKFSSIMRQNLLSDEWEILKLRLRQNCWRFFGQNEDSPHHKAHEGNQSNQKSVVVEHFVANKQK